MRRGRLVNLLRFRLRTLCVVVLAFGMGLGVWSEIERRRARFEAWRRHHMRAYYGDPYCPESHGTPIELSDCEPLRHHRLAEAYARAAARPWLPGPDPKAFGF